MSEMWEELLKEILGSVEVKGMVQYVYDNIEKGVLTLDGIRYGFGPDAYYRTPRELLLDAVYWYFDDYLEFGELVPTLLSCMTKEAKRGLEYEVSQITPKNITGYMQGENVEVSTNLHRFIEKAAKNTMDLLKEMSDTQIAEVISKIRGAK